MIEGLSFSGLRVIVAYRAYPIAISGNQHKIAPATIGLILGKYDQPQRIGKKYPIPMPKPPKIL